MALSLVFYALAVLNVFFSAQVFGGAPDLGGLAAVVPIVLVASLLPISIGGIGLAEWAYVVCLAQIGVPEEEALAVALVLRAKIVVLGLLGGIVFLALRHEPPPVSSEAA
jgi:glycosyltransferase 2 family protein